MKSWVPILVISRNSSPLVTNAAGVCRFTYSTPTLTGSTFHVYLLNISKHRKTIQTLLESSEVSGLISYGPWMTLHRTGVANDESRYRDIELKVPAIDCLLRMSPTCTLFRLQAHQLLLSTYMSRTLLLGRRVYPVFEPIFLDLGLCTPHLPQRGKHWRKPTGKGVGRNFFHLVAYCLYLITPIPSLLNTSFQ